MGSGVPRRLEESSVPGSCFVTLLSGDGPLRGCAHRLKTSAVVVRPRERHSAGVLDRPWPSAHPIPADSQETRTGYRVTPRVELAGWESGVPRCLEEVSVPGLILTSFSAVVRSTYGAGTYAVLWVWSFSEFALSHVEVYLLLAHYAFGGVADLPVPSGSPLPVSAPRHRQHFSGASLLRLLAVRIQGPAAQLVSPGWASSSLSLLRCVFGLVLGVTLLSQRLVRGLPRTIPPRCVSIKWLDGPSVPLVDSAGASSSFPKLSDVSLRSLPVTILTVHSYPCPHVLVSPWSQEEGGAPH